MMTNEELMKAYSTIQGYEAKISDLQKDSEKKIIYGKEILDIGNVLIVDEGNPYTLIEMIIRNIKAGNTTIISNNGFMYGTNQLLVQLIQSVLEQFDISKFLVQIYITEDFDKVLSNFANIDLVICIGRRELQNIILQNNYIIKTTNTEIKNPHSWVVLMVGVVGTLTYNNKNQN